MSSSIWTWVSSLVGGLLSFGLEVALLIVALTTVQKRRPEAGALLAAAAGVQMAATILAPLAFVFAARTSSSIGYIERSALIQLGITALRAVGGGLLLVGIARLAADPKDAPLPY